MVDESPTTSEEPVGAQQEQMQVDEKSLKKSSDERSGEPEKEIEIKAKEKIFDLHKPTSRK